MVPYATHRSNNTRQTAKLEGFKSSIVSHYPKRYILRILFNMYQAQLLFISLGHVGPSCLLIWSLGFRTESARSKGSIDDAHDSKHLYLILQLTYNLHAHG
jgi:hypothetical protein